GVRSFFFQAEDGIRDRNVTGVQTCALPIWSGSPPVMGHAAVTSVTAATSVTAVQTASAIGEYQPAPRKASRAATMPALSAVSVQIGRASCRARAQGAAVAGRVKRQHDGGDI